MIISVNKAYYFSHLPRLVVCFFKPLSFLIAVHFVDMFLPEFIVFSTQVCKSYWHIQLDEQEFSLGVLWMFVYQQDIQFEQ